MELRLNQILYREQHGAIDIIEQVQRREERQCRARIEFRRDHRSSEYSTVSERTAESTRFQNARSLLTFLPPRPPRDHDGRNPAARTELPFHLCPHRLGPAHHIREYLIHDVLLEDAEVSIRLEVLL